MLVLSETLTAVCAPLWFIFGQSLHHVLNPPQLLLNLDVPLAWRFCLRTHKHKVYTVICGDSPSLWVQNTNIHNINH